MKSLKEYEQKKSRHLFSLAFDSLLIGKMEQVLFAYGLSKTVTIMMMLDKNTKVMVCFPNSDIDFFSIINRVLQEDTIVPYIFIVCLDFKRL